MNTNFLYDGILKFDQLIAEMITGSDVLKVSEAVVISVFTTASSEEAYQFKNCSDEMVQRSKAMIKSLNPDVYTNKINQVKYVLVNNTMADDDIRSDFYEAFLVVINDFDQDNVMIGYVYFTLHKKYHNILAEIISSIKSFMVIEYLINYIHSKVEIYEKLYYLIDFFTEVIGSRDHFMPYHMTNVANWSMLIANEINLKYDDRLVLYISALIHDVGKMFISENIINKPDALTPEEFALMKEHPVKSYEISKAALYGMHYFKEVPNVIRSHHEWFDGSGYPDGLMGEAIPLLSRIITVADSADAMMSRRAYKEMLTEDVIIHELVKYSGTQFDPHIANIMIEILEKKSNKVNETIIADTNFIAQASLNFYYENIHTQKSYLGNLVINDQSGKLILHARNIFDQLNKAAIYKPTISFFALGDFMEYEVNIVGSLNNQVIIRNFKFLPTDKYFSLVWEFYANISGPELKAEEMKIIKFGGDTLIFEMAGHAAEHLIMNLDQVFVASLNIEVEDFSKAMNISGRIFRYFKFQNKTVFVFKYLNLTSGERDLILRILFRKQIHDKQLNANAKFGTKKPKSE